ncbi:hypothetical protein GTA08_BOTSDO07369 [Botryosphaeria dothidea]|uniref:G-protein coupled receptors family 1 profile domain-containing protein n=1 Tax=Botryosphaeria dothidea TaxID=55169 RepID=A0A8H4IQF4_9PEZI|nr:hypothetical protein GTA08_BOTSDO07369 [Botryosphaeria dothidea]
MSILMFLSLILVWAPASVNRVFLLINDNKPSTVLNTLQAAFNPCQGFCDCIIYIAMSWSSFKSISRDVFNALRGKGTFRQRTVEFDDADYDATTLEATPQSSRTPSVREMA